MDSNKSFTNGTMMNSLDLAIEVVERAKADFGQLLLQAMNHRQIGTSQLASMLKVPTQDVSDFLRGYGTDSIAFITCALFALDYTLDPIAYPHENLLDQKGHNDSE